MKNPWVIIGVVVVVLVGGSIWYSARVTKHDNMGVVIKTHTKGNPDAPVKLIEYSDFECPACKAFNPYLEDVLTQYGDNIYFEYRSFPLLRVHPYAEAAAVAAEAADQQGKFFEYHDLLFKNQDTWAPPEPTPIKYFDQYATELGLDLSQFKRQSRSSIISDAVKASYNDAVNVKKLHSTPSFYLNGKLMNFTSYQDFKNQVSAAVNPSVNFDIKAATSTTSTLVP